MSPKPRRSAATTFETTTMVNRPHEAGFYGTTTETAECNMVFVDTSIDTHLAMLVYKTDTVLDFKEKIALEHKHCFPKNEDIKIHSLKVKREASFYHLPDSMLVWSAFLSDEGNWFLSVDASSSSTCHLNQNSSELNLTKCTMLDARNVDSSCRGLSSEKKRTRQTIPLSLENTTDILNSNLTGKKCKKAKSRAKKKLKMSHTELGQDVLAIQSDTVPFKVPGISARSMDAQETYVNILETDTSTGKKKKKKSKKPADNLLQVSDNTVVSENRELAEENQHSSGNGHADVKNEKEMFTTADVQEDFPVTDQKNDIGIHKASSQFPSRQSEEKLEIAVETDDLARVTEEINFRDYFLPKTKVSSMSDHPMSGGDLSQEITRNGSSGAEGQSTAGKGTSKLDSLLDSEERILRSSKRIKKANLLASQNEADHNKS